MHPAQTALEPPPYLKYAHWLDAEYTHINNCPPSAYAAVLKLLFLLGIQVAVSDIQAWDGFVLPHCFADDGFHAFIRARPKLLQMVVGGYAEGKTQQDQHLFIATSGARRSARPGWSSSVMADKAPIVGLGDYILNSGRGALNEGALLRFSEVNSNWQEAMPHLKGVHRAVAHFANPTVSNFFSGNPKPTTYFEVVTSLLNTKGLSFESEEQLNALDAYVRSRNAEYIRDARSVLKSELEKSFGPGQPASTISGRPLWSTAVHAYNRAVQESLGVPSGSVGALSATPISIVRQDEMSVIARRESEFRGQVRNALVVSDLSWEQVGILYDETSDHREKLQGAIIQRQAGELQWFTHKLVNELGVVQARIMGQPSPESDLLHLTIETIAHFAGKAAEFLIESQVGNPALSTTVGCTLLPLSEFIYRTLNRPERRLEIALQDFYMKVSKDLICV